MAAVRNGFATANGKARIYNEELIAEGMDPVASFIAPEESRHQDAAKKYPLELLARKADNFLNSTFVNLPGHQKMEPRQHELEIAMTTRSAVGLPMATGCACSTIAARFFCARAWTGRCRREWLARAWDGRSCPRAASISMC